jgi:hypothetical protein
MRQLTAHPLSHKQVDLACATLFLALASTAFALNAFVSLSATKWFAATPSSSSSSSSSVRCRHMMTAIGSRGHGGSRGQQQL